MPAGKYTLRKIEGERIKELDLKYGTLIADILISRGIKDLDTAQKHLNGRLDQEHGDPFLMRDMQKCLERLEFAISQNQKVAIHADYDCDGIPGAVILSSLFNKINFKNYIVSIPDRNIEGYGLGENHVQNFIEQNVNLIITIDMGITAFDAVSSANDAGLDVIITDHHTIPEVVPNAFGIIHPKMFGGQYVNTELCGAGVVYTFVRGFIEQYGEKYNLTTNFTKEIVDMAAFATLSDMVELTIENKAIVKEGLERIRNNARPGLLAIARAARVYLKDLTQEDITFMIAPKLNVASRMGSPYDAYYLLMEEDRTRADERAMKLTALSNERRKLVALMVKEARREIAKFGKHEKDLIIIGHPTWKVGLLGLVASKISEIYDRPTFVWGRSTQEDKVCYKGSCRGNGSVNMYEIMKNVPEGVLLEYGGHFEAGGFSINPDRIYDIENEFLRANNATTEEFYTDNQKHIDAILPASLLHLNLHKAVAKLAPFGPGNEEPVFAFKNATIMDIRNFGTGSAHIEITFRDLSGSTASAYAFYTSSEDVGNPKIGETVHIVATLDSKLWQGTVRLRLKDVIIPNTK